MSPCQKCRGLVVGRLRLRKEALAYLHHWDTPYVKENVTNIINSPILNLKKKRKKNVSHVMHQVSRFLCQESLAMCHMLHVTCLLSHITNDNSHSH